jgi:sialidase-1
MRRSTDNGRTWGPSRRIAGDGHGTTDNPIAITDYQNGSVVFLYQHNYERCYVMRSFDDGKTFTKSVDITSVFESVRPHFDWHVIAPGVGHAIQLRSGRLLVPVWMAPGAPTSPTSRSHHPSAIATIYSDDHGKTWLAGDIIAVNSDELPNPSESMAVQLPDGRVYLSIRNESEKHRRAFAISPDGAHDWTRPEFTDALYEPICAASIVRYARSLNDPDPRILFSNPDSEDLKAQNPKRAGRLRQNLTLRMSSDGAKTWPVSRVIDAGVAGYSDVAIGRDKSIYVLYEEGAIHNSETDNAREVLVHFRLNWLTANQETGK